MYYIQLLFNEVPTGIYNSLNPRPELLVEGDDDLPVLVGHYLLDLGPEVGQGVMRVSNCPLSSLSISHHMK